MRLHAEASRARQGCTLQMRVRGGAAAALRARANVPLLARIPSAALTRTAPSPLAAQSPAARCFTTWTWTRWWSTCAAAQWRYALASSTRLLKAHNPLPLTSLALQARSTRSGPFRLREYIAGAIERFADPERTPALLHGNMEVSVTVLPTCRNARITDFATWDSMRTHLLATACIVPLAGLPMWVPGLGLVLDGGLSDLQLVRGWRRSGSFSAVHDGWGPAAAACPGSPTVHVTACPFYMSRAAIKPDKVVPPYWAFYPPEPQQLRELYAMGQRNAAAWVAARGEAEAAAACAPSPAKTPRAAAVPPSPVRAWRCAEEYAAAARAAAAGAAHGAAAKAEGAAASASALAASVAADAHRFAAECSSALQVQRSWLCGVRERSLKTLACALVYAELCCQATVSTCAAALPPALNGRVSRRRAWERAKSFVAPLPGLAQLALSPPRSSSAARLLASHAVVLTQLSLLYRLLHHAIL